MKQSLIYFTSSLLLSGLLLLAEGQRALAGDIKLEGEVTFMSDRIFRGLSRTGGNVAGSGILDLVHTNGFYAGIFVANFSDSFGHDVETDFYIGYTTSSGAYDFNFALSYDSFHGGGDSTGYFEFRGSVARDFGLAYLTAGFAITPDKREFGGGRSIYTYMGAEIPLPFPSWPPMSIDLNVGYEDFAGGFNKWDWSAGLFVDYKGLEWGIRYKETNLKGFPGSGAKALVTIRKYF